MRVPFRGPGGRYVPPARVEPDHAPRNRTATEPRHRRGSRPSTDGVDPRRARWDYFHPAYPTGLHAPRATRRGTGLRRGVPGVALPVPRGRTAVDEVDDRLI